MLVLNKPPAVILRLRHPEKILDQIPTATLLQLNGEAYVAVPHRPDETTVLRNLGHDVPSPILTQYRWGARKPFDVQVKTAEMLTHCPRAFVTNEIGTGKTSSVLWAYDFLRKKKMVKRMLVIAPLSTLERTWADEIFRWFPHLSYAVLHGSRQKRLTLLEEPADVYIINHHGLDVVRETLAQRADVDLIVADEFSIYRNKRTDLWNTLNEVANKQCPRRLWGLTGTPIPNAPTDAYGQLKMMMVPGVPRSFTAFRDLTMRQCGPFKWVPRDDAIDTVAKLMQPAVRYTRDQCMDLPPVIHETRHAELSPEQRKAYKDMEQKLRAEMEGGEILAVNEAVKASKLLQIAAGCAYAEDGTTLVNEAKPRLTVVEECVEEAEGKTIVFCPFVSSVGYVAAYLRKLGLIVECVHGGVSKPERDRIFGEFQTGSHVQVLVAQPAACSHGLTLTAASVIVWYGPVTSNEVYTQANGRISRPSQTRTQVIIHIEGTRLERLYYQRLQEKGRMEGLLLDILKDGTL